MIPEIPNDVLAPLRDYIAALVQQEVAKVVGAAPHSEPYLDTGQAARFARVSVGTIRRWVADGRLEKHGTCRRVLVSRAALEQLLRPGGKRQPVLPARKKRASAESPEQRAARLLGLDD